MHMETRTHLFQVAQKGEELLMAVAGLALRQHLAGGDIEGGEQRGGAMPDVVLGGGND